ncbi:tripartite tricarboxylate transporter substrate binding protein [Comamonas sp. J-3]|jgi:tripartite-type tricarboxylate transporter receptor subunit TctC|uniref:tripartite tricarboxylate transporter substrate binding protein n=1 Tax=Comamonas trifloxystrobinivorans TaxID=3350256 RepID=UPI0037269383
MAAGVWLGNSSMAASRFDKPITIVVTFPPGGGTDLLARKLGAALQQRIGQNVIVENRPGASGNIGARHVAEAAGDGSTLLMVNSSFAINPAVYQQLDFDPRNDFKPVLNVGTIASVLVVPQSSTLQNLADARAAAQAQELPFASCGNGTPQHMAGEMLAQAAHLHLQHVPYKGCGPAITAVAAGQVPMGVVTASSAAPLVDAGRVRAIAITAPQRLAQWPQVATVAEQGVAGFAVEQWHGLLAPAATSDARVQQMHAVLAQILAEPAMQQSLRDQGYTPVQQSTVQFGKTIASDIDRYSAVAQQLGLRVD